MVLDRDIRPLDQETKVFQVDLADTAAAAKAVQEAANALGGLDAVVTAAGTDRCGRLDEVPTNEWENVINASPLGRGRHRIQISWLTHCPVCGADCTQIGWTAERCPHDFSCVDSVQPEAVYRDVADLKATTVLPRAR